MTATSDFIDNPVKFMRENIVLTTGCGACGDAQTDNIYYVRLEPGWAPNGVAGSKPANGIRDGGPCSVYYLKHVAAYTDRPVPDDCVPIYWVPFQDQGIKGTMIGTETPFVFTAKMDGCSFALGSPTGPGGARMAAHANARGAADQSGAQKTQLRSFQIGGSYGGFQNILDPSGYRSWDEAAGRFVGEATTFAVLSDETGHGSWKLYTQRYEKGSKDSVTFVQNYIHKGLTTVSHHF